jgi:hypothetical protein
MNRNDEGDGSDFWIHFPQRLVGKRVHISWANGQFYAGKVIKYSAANGLHTIKYDDGEEKMYNMRQKTFRIVSSRMHACSQTELLWFS